MNVLIVGGSGFLGKQMIDIALAKGHQVTYLARQEGKGPLFQSSNIHYIKGDLLDLTTIDLSNQSFDLLIDCVGAIKQKQLKSLNIQTTKGAITLCKNKKIPKIVYISANTGYPAYLKSKRDAERLIKKSDLDYLIVRPNLLFGKERPLSLIQANGLFLLIRLPFLGQFFKRLKPQEVKSVAETIITTLEISPHKKLLTFSYQ
ncbi:NADH dehydrogenase [Streptococcus porcinus]|uniref:SDR family oxidoreductase n=1 Tax=Streptococcus porcinus TaxID=1340 RepID=UPI0010CAC890|nr:NAD(P)H-binding protein [Streptococcus porcinus]VTS35550.1 NADH dehydrogenase [Streptococcus porcinus]